MIAAPAVIPPTDAEVARYNDFYHAQRVADRKRPLAVEMASVVEHHRTRLAASIRAANTVYGAPFDLQTMRGYVVLGYVVDLLERVGERKDEVGPILYPEMFKMRGRG